jgi:hypothetical protein
MGRGWRWDQKEKLPDCVFEWLGLARLNKTLTVKFLANRIGMGETAVKQYAKRFADGATQSLAKGRPQALDETADKEIKVAVSAAHQRKPNMTVDQLTALIAEKMRGTAARSGRISSCDATPYIVDSTIQRLKLVSQIGQEKTDARLVAERDPLTALSTYTMFRHIYLTTSCRYLLVNFDASTFWVGGFNEQSGQVVVKLEDDDNTPMTAPQGPGASIRIGIKWYCIITAAGKSGPLVLLMQDPDLKSDVFEVPGLCINDATDELGYVVFTKDSSGNKEFYNWFLGTLLAPWLVGQRIKRSENMESSCATAKTNRLWSSQIPFLRIACETWASARPRGRRHRPP